MRQQLEAGQGEFGDGYTQRNIVDWRVRLPAFRQMLEGLEIRRLLEVGCNRGHNLLALAELLGARADVTGIEPNRFALAQARASSPHIVVLCGEAYDLPFKDAVFDLVFTAGVLIHVPLVDLPTALREICRVSRRYVLCVEYLAEEETVVPYRGRTDLLWKRDFLRHYQTTCSGLALIRSGYWGPESGFDRTHWWLLEKK